MIAIAFRSRITGHRSHKKTNIMKMRTPVTILCAILCMMLFSQCTFQVNHNPGDDGYCEYYDKYENADKYTKGNAVLRQTVKSLDLNWRSGSVSVETYDGKEVRIAEVSDKPLNDTTTMYYYLDPQGTLHVQFGLSCCDTNGHFKDLQKHLTVQIPRGTKLDDVDFDVLSADIKVGNMACEEVNIDGTSGNSRLTALNCREVNIVVTSGNSHLTDVHCTDIDIDATSGDCHLTNVRCTDINIDATSGDNFFEKVTCVKLNIDATSGHTTFDGLTCSGVEIDVTSGSVDVNQLSCRDLSIDLTSGDIEVSFDALPNHFHIDATSADIRLYVPETAGFTLSGENVSKHVKTLDIPGAKIVMHEDEIVVGDGSAQITFDGITSEITILSNR